MVLSQLSYCPTVREAGIVLRGVGFGKSLIFEGLPQGPLHGEEADHDEAGLLDMDISVL